MILEWQLNCLLLVLGLLSVEGQIPRECFNDGSLLGSERRCCPNNCGFSSNSSMSRGNCISVTSSTSNDPRINWPGYYFTHVCKCEESFGGVGCESCAYGYYPHSTCTEKLSGERRNLNDFDGDDWRKYRQILKTARNTDSGYVAVVDGTVFNPTDGIDSIRNQSRNISLYNFFVWTHYLVAKDSERTDGMKKDLAHESTGFLTWHRQMLLWLEWKIQEVLRENGEPDYHTFRLPYWDWTDTTQRTVYFREDRLGATRYDSNDSQYNHAVHDSNEPIESQMFGANGLNWETICWESKKGPPENGENCDPGEFTSPISTGPLKRCPGHNESSNACDLTNEYWPSAEDVQRAVNIQIFDTSSYDPCSTDSFRNFLEGFDVVQDCKDEDRMCTKGDANSALPCNRTRTLHNSVHLILGAGDLAAFLNNDIAERDLGVMSHVAASPNDPFFISHHAMIDCIFDEWLKKGYEANYPTDVNKGWHQRDEYIIPFIPVFRHSEMFQPAGYFGYSCDLSHIIDNGEIVTMRPLALAVILLIGVVAALM